MGRLQRGTIFRPPHPTHDVIKSTDLRRLVREICVEQDIQPPAWIAVLGSEKRCSNAMAVRLGPMGTGFLVITPALFEDLDDEERRFVLRHELAHYRHAESRWSLLQAMAFLLPVWVVVFGHAIAQVVGEVMALALYFVSLVVHVLAFRSKRFFERRADREAILSPLEALVAKRTLLKVSTLKKRRNLTEGTDIKRVLDEFEQAAKLSPNFSLRLFNCIWGTHPLIQERLQTYEKLANSGVDSFGRAASSRALF